MSNVERVKNVRRSFNADFDYVDRLKEPWETKAPAHWSFEEFADFYKYWKYYVGIREERASEQGLRRAYNDIRSAPGAQNAKTFWENVLPQVEAAFKRGCEAAKYDDGPPPQLLTVLGRKLKEGLGGNVLGDDNWYTGQ